MSTFNKKFTRLPVYGDILCKKIKLQGKTFYIGLALPDGIDVRYPCYYLYVFERGFRANLHPIVGHPDVSFIFQYLIRNFV